MFSGCSWLLLSLAVVVCLELDVPSGMCRIAGRLVLASPASTAISTSTVYTSFHFDFKRTRALRSLLVARRQLSFTLAPLRGARLASPRLASSRCYRLTRSTLLRSTLRRADL